jgi:heavy metal-binding protein
MLFAVVALVLGLVQTPRAAPPPDLRFHHLHLRVVDPASSSREAAARLNSTRTILQGHGLSVRAGSEYLVFDRAEEATRTFGPEYAAAVYRSAVEWASRMGLIVEPADFNTVGVRDAAPPARIDKIAFSSTDPAGAVERLIRQGASPFERTEDVARFRLPNELILEIIAETDKPDTHWCPMHPDVRAPGAGKCSICGMDLVPIPPPRIGEYRLSVTTTTEPRGHGISEIHLRVLDPETDEPVNSFLEVHEKRLHLFIVSRDLEYFAHVHPDHQSDGSFAIRHELPAGEYVLIGDFLPADGTPQMVQRVIVTPGYRAVLFGQPVSLRPTAHEQIVDGIRVRMELESLRPLRPSILRFLLSDAVTGAPLTDLEPYLGVPGHLLIVDGDLKFAIHAHPEGRVSSGPPVTFEPVLPAAGRYKLWVQFQRGGRVITAAFVIEVPSP